MNGLHTARVIVVDNEFSEIEPLLRGLSQLGIGALYFNGEEIPAFPLLGIRLVFLDLHLLDASGGAHGAILNTIGVLSKLIPGKKGEVGIICWTKHSNEVEDLIAKLDERWPEFGPAFVMGLSKAEFLKLGKNGFDRLAASIGEIFSETEKQITSAASEGKPLDVWATLSSTKSQASEAVRVCAEADPEHSQANIDALRERIEAMLNELRGSRLLWEWEQAVHNAASETTSLIHEIASARKEGEQREDALMTVLSSLVIAAGGDSLVTPANAAANLFEGINPIHADFLDQLASNTEGDAAHYQHLLEAVQSGKALNPLQQAQTNAAILTAKIPQGSTRFQPGNLYIADAENSAGCPHALCKIQKFELGYGMLNPADNEKCKELNHKIQGQKKLGLSPKEVEDLKAELQNARDGLLAELLTKCLAGVLEVTPSCDFNNKKFTPARFVGCLLVPNELKDRIHDGDFIRRIRPLTLQSKDTVWHVLLNGRFMFGVSNPTEQIKTTPFVRIRLPVLVDIQAWLAAQGARPGYVAV